MISIDPFQNSERDNYKLLIGSIIPRPIAFVTSQTKDGTINGAPFSYFNIVSSNPPMISLAIQRKNGMPKDTAHNIQERKEFVVHIVDEQNVTKINETAASLPPDESELDVAQLATVDSRMVSVPGIKEAKVRMECVLEQAVALGGNGDTPGVDLIIGKVVQFHFDEEIYFDGKIDPDALRAVSRLAGNNYAKVGEIFEIERPK
ncbi:flavin reductase family protein [Siminovitchia acidinfaciens]|uniref:Flavin reductase family protein n=1 Tax=Siminovitchia acidinfaciens TaxID=2321395 RepID=A0A429Y7S1_9BACI|nr:flavin reductase family protein [Siminovitchia acidinfaciens]RST77452.1 flavin reductase family protein [Siminovitchia acidinfaciens]